MCFLSKNSHYTSKEIIIRGSVQFFWMSSIIYPFIAMIPIDQPSAFLDDTHAPEEVYHESPRATPVLTSTAPSTHTGNDTESIPCPFGEEDFDIV